MNNVQLSMGVPIGFKELIYALLNSFSPAVTKLQSLNYVIYIPPNGISYIGTLSPDEEGWVILFASPINTSSTYHDVNIVATYNVYGESTWVTGITHAMTKDFDFDVSLYHGLGIRKIEFTYSNNSTVGTYVTLTVDAFLVEKSFYDKVVMPVLRQGIKHIQDYVNKIAKESESL